MRVPGSTKRAISLSNTALDLSLTCTHSNENIQCTFRMLLKLRLMEVVITTGATRCVTNTNTPIICKLYAKQLIQNFDRQSVTLHGYAQSKLHYSLPTSSFTWLLCRSVDQPLMHHLLFCYCFVNALHKCTCRWKPMSLALSYSPRMVTVPECIRRPRWYFLRVK